MAFSARIDAVSFPASGGVQVDSTTGPTPLPPASGTGDFFASKTDLQTAIADAEAQIGALAKFIALANWIKADPNMLTPSLAANTIATIDLTGSASAITLG